ncbi:unnamed protein product [Cylicostephanus goldi]|uniref:Uncharacterized protein n=1 Tax=Cylicostephanus goldi TaxID=71465 RepID=A0A3P7LQV7_CYLGO|nr:unnamed protein product [Cylicostephanus goldi]
MPTCRAADPSRSVASGRGSFGRRSNILNSSDDVEYLRAVRAFPGDCGSLTRKVRGFAPSATLRQQMVMEVI